MNVSIIIPAYNAADTLADTLESLLAQTDANWEAIVVDDGSSDGTGKLAGKFAKRDARIRLLRQANGGEAAARNAGIPAARFDWLLFLDADDWIAPEYLARMTAELAAHPELDAVHCGYARVAADGSVIPEPYQPPAGDMFAIWARRSAFPVHACVVRKSLVEAAGQFDPSLRKSPDWDLWQRIARIGARFGAVREVLAYYRMRPNAASLDARQMLRDGLRVLRQGHAPDARVPTPHPDHAAGSPPEEVRTQEFYLLSWCAGLLLGTGKDARPLLKLLEGEHYPELYPEAVAQCVFEAAPLPTCGPPAAWEQLWPRIQQEVGRFLLALEAQAQAPDLARRADAALRRMILTHAPSWHAVIEAYEQGTRQQQAAIEELEQARQHAQQLGEEQQRSLTSQEARIDALERTMAGLSVSRDDWQRSSEERERANDALTARLADLEQVNATLTARLADLEQLNASLTARLADLEQVKASLTARLADLEQVNASLTARLADLEQVNASLTARLAELEQTITALQEERDEWRRLSEAREATIASQAGRIAELEQANATLLRERNDWERLSRERAFLLVNLHARRWVRLGTRLGMLPSAPWPTPPGSAAAEPGGTWQLQVGASSAAQLAQVPGDPDAVRVTIEKAGSKESWDIQLNQAAPSVVSQGRYAVRFRARAERSRTVNVGVAQARPPWEGLGLYRVFKLTREWQSFQADFVATAGDDNPRIHFDVGASAIAVEVATVSLDRLPEPAAGETDIAAEHSDAALPDAEASPRAAPPESASGSPPTGPAPEGRLKRPVIPSRSLALRAVSSGALSSELLARIAKGAFSGSEEEILLGCGMYDALQGALEVHNNRWSARRYRDLFGDFYGSLELPRPPLDGRTVVDLGCGSLNPYGMLFLFLMLGAQRGIAIDLDDVEDVPRALRALADLAAMLLINPADILGDYPVSREELLRNVASFDLGKLRAGDPAGLDAERLSFLRESAFALPLREGEAGFMISNSFFEHIPHAEAAIREMARVTGKGGIGVHIIDGSDHRRYEDPSRHPLDFLTEGPGEPMLYGSNRILPLEFGPLFERHGFEVLGFVPFVRDELPPGLRRRMLEPFRSLPDAVLTAYMGKLVVRRL